MLFAAKITNYLTSTIGEAIFLRVFLFRESYFSNVMNSALNNSRPTMYVNRYGRILFQLLVYVFYFIIVEITVSVKINGFACF